jgi:hypothetical protein
LEVDTLIDPSGAPEETLDAKVPIDSSPIIVFIIKLCKFPEESTMVDICLLIFMQLPKQTINQLLHHDGKLAIESKAAVVVTQTNSIL